MSQVTITQRIVRVITLLTHRDHRSTMPEYGSWLLGRAKETQQQRQIRLQSILTILMIATNLVGLSTVLLLLKLTYQSPSIITNAPGWLTFEIAPGYIFLVLTIGTILDYSKHPLQNYAGQFTKSLQDQVINVMYV